MKGSVLKNTFDSREKTVSNIEEEPESPEEHMTRSERNSDSIPNDFSARLDMKRKQFRSSNTSLNGEVYTEQIEEH